MKLYFSPGACSLSPHIALREAGISFDTEQVDLKTKVMKSGGDYRLVNPKGAVPALRLDDGQILTEGAAIVQYIADRKPEKKLAPAMGTPERYRLQEWLNFIATEVHKGISPMFNPKASDEWKEVVKGIVGTRFDFLEKDLDGRSFLMGDAFTVADAYLFTVLRWTKRLNIDLARWPILAGYFDRIGQRPQVREAMSAEGIS